MGTIKTFRDLIVWQKSMHLVTQIYWASGNFPKSEFYGLISQLRRSEVQFQFPATLLKEMDEDPLKIIFVFYKFL